MFENPRAVVCWWQGFCLGGVEHARVDCVLGGGVEEDGSWGEGQPREFDLLEVLGD